jgi:hypothetical protein
MHNQCKIFRRQRRRRICIWLHQKLVNLVRAGRWLVAVVLVDDDGVGDVLHHDALEPQVAGEAHASLKTGMSPAVIR